MHRVYLTLALMIIMIVVLVMALVTTRERSVRATTPPLQVTKTVSLPVHGPATIPRPVSTATLSSSVVLPTPTTTITPTPAAVLTPTQMMTLPVVPARPITPASVVLTTTTSPAMLVLPPFPEAQLTTILSKAGGTFGVVVYDVASHTVVYTQNEEVAFSAASTIKLPIALTVYHLALQGTLNLDEQLVLQVKDIVGGAGRLQSAPPGTSYTIRDLCVRMIADSDNTATNMLLTRIGGFAPVNTLMEHLGASHTRIERMMMDLDALDQGIDNSTTPSDMLLLLQLLEQGNVTDAAGAQELLTAMQQTVNRQKLPARLPPEVVVIHKTGSLPDTEHDVGIVVLPSGHRYHIVMMSNHLVSNQAGIDAIAEASALIFTYEQQLDV